MSLNIDPYLHHLSGFDLSDGQKADIIRSVHLVMESFVDLAFGLDATQISLGISADGSGAADLSTLDLPISLPSTFNDAAHGDAARKTPS